MTWSNLWFDFGGGCEFGPLRRGGVGARASSGLTGGGGGIADFDGGKGTFDFDCFEVDLWFFTISLKCNEEDIFFSCSMTPVFHKKNKIAWLIIISRISGAIVFFF